VLKASIGGGVASAACWFCCDGGEAGNDAVLVAVVVVVVVGAEKPVEAADGEAQAVVAVGVGADVGVGVVVVELVAVELVAVELVGVELVGALESAAKPGKSSCRYWACLLLLGAFFRDFEACFVFAGRERPVLDLVGAGMMNSGVKGLGWEAGGLIAGAWGLGAEICCKVTLY
jgi:hypothetical protein